MKKGTISFIYSLLLLSVFLVFASSCEKNDDDNGQQNVPVLSTLAVTEITANTAKSGGNVTNNGGTDITSKGIVWSTSQNPSFEQHTGITVEDAGDGLFQSTLTGLSQNTTYYVKAYATNSVGTAYGNQMQFTTETAGSAPVAAFTANTISGTAPLIVNFTDQSTNSPTSWQWNFGDGTTNDQQNPSHTYQNAGTYTVSLTVTNSHASDKETKNNYITVTSGGGGINDVFSPATGQTWMDRNLGASRAATSSTDDQAYGDLYQWGRLTDGHEKRNSGTTSTLSNSDTPGHGDFIIFNVSTADWRSPQNNNLWQGVSGTNNPCPAGYRLPTEAEWDAERQSWSSNNAVGAFNSPLKLPMAGGRNLADGSLYNVGTGGGYWASSVDGTGSKGLFFSNSNTFISGYARAYGVSVRCIKD